MCYQNASNTSRRFSATRIELIVCQYSPLTIFFFRRSLWIVWLRRRRLKATPDLITKVREENHGNHTNLFVPWKWHFRLAVTRNRWSTRIRVARCRRRTNATIRILETNERGKFLHLSPLGDHTSGEPQKSMPSTKIPSGSSERQTRSTAHTRKDTPSHCNCISKHSRL